MNVDNLVAPGDGRELRRAGDIPCASTSELVDACADLLKTLAVYPWLVTQGHVRRYRSAPLLPNELKDRSFSTADAQSPHDVEDGRRGGHVSGAARDGHCAAVVPERVVDNLDRLHHLEPELRG